MGVVKRGVKNAFRNTIRSFSIIFILALSIAMSLVMLLAYNAVGSKIESVKGSIGNTINVSPAGVRGFEGGGELLTASDVTTIAGLSHVSGTVQTLSDRLRNGDTTSLESSVEPGSFGRRMQGSANSSGQENPAPENSDGGTSSTTQRTFSMPIEAIASSNLDTLASLNISELKITSGEKFEVASTKNEALVGSSLATKNSLSVGSTFTAYSTEIKVVGIFDAGNTFANSSLIVPLFALQKLSAQTDQINSIIVTADSIENVASVVTAIKEKLGDKADVVSQQDSSSSAVAPLENIKTISLYSLIGSLIAGAIIIFLTMMMIVRERRREIGVLKAIGSSNIRIVSQFITESLVLTLTGGVAGIILGVLCSNPVLQMLMTTSESTTRGQGFAGGAGRGMMSVMMPGMQNILNNVSAVVGYEIILYGLGAAIIIAIIGSAIPAFFISKVRPAEVMRNE